MARRYWLDMPKVARLVPREADVVNAHEWLALRPGRIAARRLSVPLVWTRNDESLWERAIVPEDTIIGDPRITRRAARAALCWPDLIDARRADAIVVLSADQVEMVRRSYRRDALIVPVGPPEHFFERSDRKAARARLGIPDDAFLVAGAGILVRHRRFEDLIRAISLLIPDDPAVRALIVGSDHVDGVYADHLSALVAELGLASHVAIPRRSVPDSEMKDTYAAADVFVLLSERYAWGLAPLEAIAAGTPVIVSRGAGVQDILAGRSGVQVVPPKNPATLAAAIRRWRLRTGAERKGLESTRAWLRAEYAIEKYVDRMEEIYTSVRR
jgi:glycosyltransferase involved in cell wall biosynthesis